MELIQLAKEIAPNLNLKDGYQDCPFCHRTKKLKVSAHHYRCYHPECSQQGGLIDFAMHFKQCDRKAAIKIIKELEGQSTADISAWKERSQFFELVFSTYQNGVDDQTLEFLNGRGYVKALESEGILFGHAVGDRFLQDQGVQLKDLMKYGLAYPDGREFFRNRVIFPVRDYKGRLVHMQGRATNGDEDLRWLSTSSKLESMTVAPISQYLYEAHYYMERDKIEWLFLAEGISDGLSLVEMDVPAVACFGVEVDLIRFTKLFERVSNLVVLLDNDRYALLTPYAGQYKSWRAMLPHLVELKLNLPQLNIWCCPPPTKSGIKDINNWLNKGLTSELFGQYVIEHKQSLFDFLLTSFGQQLEFHPLLIKLLATESGAEESERFRKLITDLRPDFVSYLIDLHGYF